MLGDLVSFWRVKCAVLHGSGVSCVRYWKWRDRELKRKMIRGVLRKWSENDSKTSTSFVKTPDSNTCILQWWKKVPNFVEPAKIELRLHIRSWSNAGLPNLVRSWCHRRTPHSVRGLTGIAFAPLIGNRLRRELLYLSLRPFHWVWGWNWMFDSWSGGAW